MLPLLLKIAGTTLVGLSLLHAVFPKRFGRDMALGHLSLLQTFFTDLFAWTWLSQCKL